MKILLTILFFIILSASIPVRISKHFATTYYVSAAGNNANNGTSISTPWQTLSKLGTVTFSAGDIILLRRGDTFQEALPTPNGGVTYSAYGSGADPILSGLTSLTTWTNLGGNIWEATLNSGSFLNVVTINGQVTAKGRYPNYNTSTGGFLIINSHTFVNNGNGTSSGSLSSAALTGTWTGAEAVSRSQEWLLDRLTITGQTGTTISYNNPWDTQEPNNGHGFFIQNSLATLDAQNEWYYDAAAAKLKLYSTVNPSTLNVKASVIERLVSFEFRNNVTLSNIQFVGADEYAIHAFSVTGMTVQNCRVEMTGVDGIKADGWSNSSINNTTVYRSNNCGIDMSYSSAMVVNNNTISRSGLLPGMGLSNNQQHDGIKYENAGSGTVINNNRIDSTGYCGIKFNGNNTIVRNNHITNFCMTVADGGGIYTNGDNPPAGTYRIVEDNIVQYGIGNPFGTSHSTPGGAIGIYTDDRSYRCIIRRNTIGFCSRNAILLHNSQDMVVTDNLIHDNEIGVLFGHDGIAPEVPTRSIVFKRNTIIMPLGKWAIENGTIDNDFNLQFSANDSNYFARQGPGNIITTNWGNYPTVPTTYNNYTLPTWKAAFSGYDVNSTFTTLPADITNTRVEYNTTSSSVTRPLNGVYRDLQNNIYTGSVTIPAYSSVYLIYSSAGAQPNAIQVKGKIVIAGP